MKTVTGNLYNKYGTSNPLYRRLVGQFEQHLFKLLDETHPSSMLEIGCGEGHWLAQIAARRPQTEIVGLDIGLDVLKKAQTGTTGVPLIVGDAGKLPFNGPQFDLVLAAEVLEHVPDPMTVVREMGRITKAYCVVSVPHEPWWRMLNMARMHYLRALGNTPGHIQHFTPRSLKRLLEAEFEVQKFNSVFPWLFALCKK